MNYTIIRIKEVDLDFFVEAVLGNNQMNGSSWSQWDSGKEIIDVYTDFGEIPYSVTFLEDREYIESQLDKIILESKASQ
ncbi:hypothetical protein OQB66_00985 [Pseudomonas syringae]|uniref:hypothetical protein n=1 Tax=Pseudomonas syringae TaxID=317 RepID=UPI00224B30AD|nr:hypothetical protein [Pseudomonas syringae]UZS72949.1 hypothetical protein OQB66_00985 [Pseudomonas syringae]